MSGRSDKRNQRYAYFLGDIYKITCLIHVNVSHSSDRCKVLNRFGTRYATGVTFK